RRYATIFKCRTRRLAHSLRSITGPDQERGDEATVRAECQRCLLLSRRHVTLRSPIPSHQWRPESMKRTFAIVLAAVVAAAVFAGLVHAVLVAAHVSEPAATTVYGVTPRRLWATMVAAVALFGLVVGGLALARPA